MNAPLKPSPAELQEAAEAGFASVVPLAPDWDAALDFADPGEPYDPNEESRRERYGWNMGCGDE